MQQDLKAALKVYASKEGLVDAAASINQIRQKVHAHGLNQGECVSTITKANQLAAKARQVKYGIGRPQEHVFCELQQKMVHV